MYFFKTLLDNYPCSLKTLGRATINIMNKVETNV